MTRFLLFLESFTESPYDMWALGIYGALACAIAVLLICGYYEWRWRQRQTRYDVRYVATEADRQAALRRVRSFYGPAAKGFRSGFTRDDAVVEDVTRRRQLNAITGDRNRA